MRSFKFRIHLIGRRTTIVFYRLLPDFAIIIFSKIFYGFSLIGPWGKIRMAKEQTQLQVPFLPDLRKGLNSQASGD